MKHAYSLRLYPIVDYGIKAGLFGDTHLLFIRFTIHRVKANLAIADYNETGVKRPV